MKVMITGANAGIGRATARLLAERGAEVVMVCRNAERGEPARRDVAEKSGNPNVELLTADFESQDEVRALAAAFKRRHDRLDVLINNAGLYVWPRRETAAGLEVTWAVNHLAPFLLTNLLLDVLTASAPARIVNVSSNSHYQAKDGIRFDDVEMKKGYRWLDAYSQSKLANVLFTVELARRLDGTGVTATAMHPGVVATKIWTRNFNPISLLMLPVKLFMTRPATAAEAVARLAIDPALEGVTGKYFDRMDERRPSRAARDAAAARRLWTLSEAMTGLD